MLKAVLILNQRQMFHARERTSVVTNSKIGPISKYWIYLEIKYASNTEYIWFFKSGQIVVLSKAFYLNSLNNLWQQWKGRWKRMFASQLHVWWSQDLQEWIRWGSWLLLILGVWGGQAQVSWWHSVCCKDRSVRQGLKSVLFRIVKFDQMPNILGNWICNICIEYMITFSVLLRQICV